ncbi:MAG: hypothetical protein EP330_29500 [Deltaproteobacteria bacterium]|nr:MAG: hypothetical protein EP330_29500 [Deltaproteobacteria bacterium]
MRFLSLLLLLACAKPVTAEVPYIDTTVEVKRARPLRVLERGSGVVAYGVAPARVTMKNPGVATVVRFDGEARFHVFGEAVGETVLVADLGDVRHQLPIEVVAEAIDSDFDLAVGQVTGLALEGVAERVVVGDPAVLGFKVGADGRSVQIQALAPGRSHVVVSTGTDRPPTFAWVVVE